MSLIVAVRPDEAMRLAEVGELTALAYLADGLLDAAHPYVPHLRDAKVRAEQAILLIMADGEDGQGKAVGTLTVVPSGSSFAEFSGDGEVELRMLAVSPLERGRGIGEQLTRQGMEMARSLNARRVLLSTMETMDKAHRLYEKLGFVRVPELDWVAHEDRSKTACDAQCLAPDGSCTQGGHRLLAYAWTP